ncbi:MAG: hypothetical protein HYT98_00695 [Candidatus Sungbacteria bacterium]|nr:hypothetical protein [Candidatus Sungbacteria bacterium]
MGKELPIEKQNLNIEFNSRAISKRLVELLDKLCGQVQWEGDTPYKIQVIDADDKKAYVFAIRKGENWYTVQQRESNNPSLVRTYTLEKKTENWDYIDPYQIKCGASSLPALRGVLDKLQKVWELSQPKKIDSNIDTANNPLPPKDPHNT